MTEFIAVMKSNAASDQKSIRFTSIPTGQRLAQTIYYCFLVLTIILGNVGFATARFGPLRGTFLDFYFISTGGFRNAVAVTGIASLLGFGASWLACPDLRHRHRYLNAFIFVMALLALATPG